MTTDREPHVPPEFLRLADHLPQLARALADMVLAPPSAGSRSKQESLSEPYAGAWGSAPMRDVQTLPPMLMIHAKDHLLAVAAAMKTPGVIYATLSLVRPALESASSAFYLLDPEADVEERFRRGMNFHLQSAVERVRMAQGFGMCRDDMISAGMRLAHLQMGADRHGFEVTMVKRRGLFGRDRWIGQRPPSGQRLLEQLLGDDADTGPRSRFIHQMTSAVIHGQMHGLLLFAVSDQYMAGDEPGLGTVPIGVDIKVLATWVTSVLLGLDRVVRRACDHYGWDIAAWQTALLATWLNYRQALGMPPLHLGGNTSVGAG